MSTRHRLAAASLFVFAGCGAETGGNGSIPDLGAPGDFPLALDDSGGAGRDGGGGGFDFPLLPADGGCGLRTCQSAHATCGPIGDGCGGILDCGVCALPQTCGGGGVLGQCGAAAPCVPRSCAQGSANCGPIGDGCGGLLDCGKCPNGQSCGGGGMPSRCATSGNSADGGMQAGGCTPATCQQLGWSCGPAGDGCGAMLDCGKCPNGQTCGGGGKAGQCGANPPCVPQTCAGANVGCGPIGDGCGAMLDCGKCPNGQTCGGGGTPSQCGAGNHGMPPMPCTPLTCQQLNLGCGPAGDGCGNTLDCSTCQNGQTCGGGGKAGQCGAQVACVPQTCAGVGANCGPIGNGCGGTLDCGKCSAPDICGGGGVPSVCGGTTGGPCVNLCLQQMPCKGGTPTTVSGTVYNPAGTDPLYNALVYVPNGTVKPFPAGVSCDQCGALASGLPLVSATTDYAGKFVLQNVPAGANIPLVIQIGRWRRVVTIPSVTACTDNPLDVSLTRLPRNHNEGDIPRMAIVTGAVDAIECVLLKIGLDQAEFDIPQDDGGQGRVDFYGPWADNDGQGDGYGADIGSGAPDQGVLMGDPARLAEYDLVLLPCEGLPFGKKASWRNNLVGYTTQGGRLFATHYSYAWIYNTAPFNKVANWNVGQPFLKDPLTGIVDQSFPKGVAFAKWLAVVGAATGKGTIAIHSPRHDVDGVVSPSQRYIYSVNPSSVQQFTFNTPVGAQPAAQCGRVLYSDFHVQNNSSLDAFFPNECAGGALTPQEKVLEFMLFDLSSCIQPDNLPPPTCTARTCMQAGASCGPVADGCGALLDCGTCPAGQTCGGGGMASVCGGIPCVPLSCQSQNLQCGSTGDGCGNVLQCGSCPAGETCGGAGMNGQCGAPPPPDAGIPCTAQTCQTQNIQCGPAGDGCGNLIQCGSCPAGQTCGGGGKPGQCGGTPCPASTCQSQKLQCGPAGDGCGNLIQCGSCPAGQTCGGGGVNGQCGAAPPVDGGVSCMAQTCQTQNINCGPAGDGCGNLIQCGSCPAGQTCGGGGVPGQCGGNVCTPRTCHQVGALCGAIGDGCGGAIQCGSCVLPDVCGGGGVANVCGHIG